MNAQTRKSAPQRRKRLRHALPDESPDAEVYFNPVPLDQQLPMEPTVAGRSGWGPEGVWSRKASHLTAIELTLAGNGILEVNHVIHHAGPRDVIILHRGEDHTYRTGSAGQWNRLFMTFLEGTVDLLLKRLGLEQSTIVHLGAKAARSVAKRMNAVKHFMRDQTAGSRVEIAATAFEIILIIAHAAAGTAPSRRAVPAKVADVTRFVQEHIEKRMSVEMLARRAGCSRSHLERLFHKHFGTGVHRWVITTRITRAALHLLIDDRPIAHIAANVGYADVYQFSAAFKRITGLAPRAYRQERRRLSVPQ